MAACVAASWQLAYFPHVDMILNFNQKIYIFCRNDIPYFNGSKFVILS